MSVLGLDHIQIAIPEGGEALARHFYGGVPQLEEVEKPVALRAYGGVWLQAGAIGVHLGVDADFRPQLKAHPGLIVAALDDMLERARSLGLKTSDPDRFLAWRRAYVFDPFGNRLELLEAAGAGSSPR